MKPVSIMLASWIMLLSIQTLISQIPTGIFQANKCEASCSAFITKCNHCPQQPSNPNSNNPCAAGTCNPFQTCTYCFGMIIESSSFQFAAKPDARLLNYSWLETIPSNYYSSCWHPPNVNLIF